MRSFYDGRLALEILRVLNCLVRGGAPLDESVKRAAEQIDDGEVARVLRELSSDLSRGRSLGQSLERAACFSGDLLSVIRLGEDCGKLPEVLSRSSEFLEADLRMRRWLYSTMAYPMLLISALCLVLTVFANSFQRHSLLLPSSADLSWPMLFISSFWSLVDYLDFLLLPLGLFVLFSFFLQGSPRAPRLTALWDWIFLRFPGMGALCKYRSTARMSWLLHLSLSAGMELPKALHRLAKSDLPAAFRRLLADLALRAEKGMKLSERIRDSKELPFTCRCLLSLSEESNSLLPSLQRLAEIYEGETRRLAKTMPKLMALAAMLFVSLLVLLTLLAMYYPLVRLPLLEVV